MAELFYRSEGFRVNSGMLNLCGITDDDVRCHFKEEGILKDEHIEYLVIRLSCERFIDESPGDARRRLSRGGGVLYIMRDDDSVGLIDLSTGYTATPVGWIPPDAVLFRDGKEVRQYGR